MLTARAEDAAGREECCGARACRPGECEFTSARVRTYGKFSVAPADKRGSKTVRVEARVALPSGAGLWPAIWMLPEDSPPYCSGCGAYGQWAASGAITLAQATNAMTTAFGGAAYGGPWPAQNSSSYTELLPLSATGFHVFALEWSLEKMSWFIDGKEVFSLKPAALNGGDGWFTTAEGAPAAAPFDKSFHLLLNLAVGGAPTGATRADAAAALATPKSMRVDYVRVCKQ